MHPGDRSILSRYFVGIVYFFFFCLPFVSVRLYDEATAREEEVEVEGHSSDPGFCVGWKQRGGRPHFCWWIYSGSNPDPLPGFAVCPGGDQKWFSEFLPIFIYVLS